jgi:hypothetical protein
MTVSTARTTAKVLPEDRPAEIIPPLENGARLSRAEFERRYQAMPHLAKSAESRRKAR